MRKILFIAIVISFALCSCDTVYMLVERNISHSKTLIYDINSTGNIDQRATVDVTDIVKTLADDIDSRAFKFGYTLKKLTMQSISLEIVKNTTNVANTMNIESVVADVSNSVVPGKPLMRQTNIPINTASLIIANTYLTFEGVDEVNKALATAVARLGRNTRLAVDIKGNSIPAGSRVSAQLIMHLKFDMEYSYCQDVTFLMLDDFIECKR